MLAAPYAYGAVGAYPYAGAYGAPYGAYGLGYFNQQGQHHPMQPGMQNLNLWDDIKGAAQNAGNWVKNKMEGKQQMQLQQQFSLGDIAKSINTGIAAAGQIAGQYDHSGMSNKIIGSI